MPKDRVERIVEQWGEERPDLDVSPAAIVGRLSRLSRLIDRHLRDNFATFDLEAWGYDVLATLFRSGAPYRLTAGDLGDQTMITTGALTNRVDRLTERGLVARVEDPADRRRVLVELTSDGKELVESVAPTHLAVEREILAVLDEADQQQLSDLLKALLVSLGDLDDT